MLTLPPLHNKTQNELPQQDRNTSTMCHRRTSPASSTARMLCHPLLRSARCPAAPPQPRPTNPIRQPLTVPAPSLQKLGERISPILSAFRSLDARALSPRPTPPASRHVPHPILPLPPPDLPPTHSIPPSQQASQAGRQDVSQRRTQYPLHPLLRRWRLPPVIPRHSPSGARRQDCNAARMVEEGVGGER